MSRTSVTPRSVRRWPAVVVALAAPLALVVVLLAAAWSPADGLPRVQAAIVNLDEPVTLEGQYTPLGRQLAGALTQGEEVDANYDWVVTDAQRAADGLEDGTFAAVVTIPENFSAAATSFASGDDVEQATIEITTPPGATTVDRTVASAVTATATRVLGSQLTTTYVENVLVGFTTLGDELGEAADGAVQLADGASQLADGTVQLSDGATGLADGAAQLASGTGQLRGGSYELAEGTHSLAAGAGQLAGGAQQLAGGAQQLAGGAQQLADGTGQSAAGARELANGAGSLAGGTSKLSAGLAATSEQVANGMPALVDALAQLSGGLGQLVPALSQVNDGIAKIDENLRSVEVSIARIPGCEADDAVDETCAQLTATQRMLQDERAELVETKNELELQLDALVTGAGNLSTQVDAAMNGDGAGNPGLIAGLQALATGAADLDGGAQQLAGGAGQLADGLDQLAAGASQLASGTSDLATGASGLASGAGDLAGGAQQLAGGSSQLAAGVAQLDGGAQQLADGAGQLAGGTPQLADGARQLADGTAQLGDGLGQAVEQLPSTPEDQRADLAKVVTAPVAAPATSVSGPLGQISTLVAVTLWVGALVLFLVFRPLPVRVAGSTRSPLALAWDALALPVAVSAVAGAAVGALAGAITDQSGGDVLGLTVVGAVAAVALAAFHQAVAAWFGTAGRVVAVVAGFVFLVAGLAATVPSWVGATVAWLPLTATSDAVGAVVGETAASLGGAIVGLALWAVASVLATAGAAARARQAVGARTVAAYA